MGHGTFHVSLLTSFLKPLVFLLLLCLVVGKIIHLANINLRDKIVTKKGSLSACHTQIFRQVRLSIPIEDLTNADGSFALFFTMQIPLSLSVFSS
ncbi:hypothetical protein Bca4012_035016 [Brassica carinata]